METLRKWHTVKFLENTPAACSFPGENARSWEALGEARPGQSSLSAGALRKEAACQCRRHEIQVRSLGQEDPLREGHGNPLQYSCLENLMNRGAWWATVDGIAKGHD